MSTSKCFITLVLNSNQSIKKTVLVSSAPASLPSSILSAIKQKLQIKKPRIFTEEGVELIQTDQFEAKIKNKTILIISAGEPFIGSSKSPTSSSTHSAAVSVLEGESPIEPKAISQLYHTASLPHMVYAVGMPDLHPGNDFPIGASFISTDIVYPALIGGDIGCGMQLWNLPKLPAHSLNPDKIANKLRGLEGPWGGDTEAWLQGGSGVNVRGDVMEMCSKFGSSLGTVGGGNHFAELQVVERVVDGVEFNRLGLKEQNSYLLVHSGSRGLGQSILRSQPQNSGHRHQSDSCTAYLAAHHAALHYAKRNRDLIALRFLTCLNSEVGAVRILDVWHNCVEEVVIDGAPHFIHRKGAAPSDRGPVVIPGSRGDFSYLVIPTARAGLENGFSLAHGAGRVLSRGSARETFKEKYQGVSGRTALERTLLGSAVVCDGDLWYEEVPEAYKAVDSVVSDLKEYCSVIAIFRPVVTYKLRKE